MALTTSQKGLNFIKAFEELHLTAYDDGYGTWTIGYGHTANVTPGMQISESDALSYLKMDLASTESTVRKAIITHLTQNMFDALVSFCFNIGSSAFTSSTLVKMLNAGNIPGAANEFDRWIYSQGQISSGLITRRAAEKNIFMNNIYNSAH